MERVTLRVPKRQVEELEQLVEDGEFPNRSEAIRGAIRDMLKDHRQQRGRRRKASPYRQDGGRR